MDLNIERPLVLMVPLSERRHRLYDQEIPEAIKGLVLRLRQLLEKREDRESAETAFRALYRLTNAEPGRPKYPELTWENIQLARARQPAIPAMRCEPSDTQRWSASISELHRRRAILAAGSCGYGVYSEAVDAYCGAGRWQDHRACEVRFMKRYM